MKLTKASEYGILTLVYLAKQPEGQLCDTTRIAELERIPVSFLGKLIPSLVKAGLVRSVRGSRGGIALARAASAISLRDIVEATEGEIVVNDCTASKAYDCYRAGCSVQGALRIAQEQFLKALEGFTLAGLAETERTSRSPVVEIALAVVST